MIPILFAENSTTFDTMGMCALSDTTNAVVRRVLNGKDELEIQYPINGPAFGDLRNSRIILAQPEYKKRSQPYRIYKVTKPMKGLVTVFARHISEQKMFLVVKPFSAGSINEMITHLPNKIVGEHPFTFWTDKNTVARYNKTNPESLGRVLGGAAGSILDVYGGEYEFDGYNVKIWKRRGVDRGVAVEYAKNLTGLEVTQTVDESVYTSICPIWHGMESDEVAFLPEFIVDGEYVESYPYRRAIVVDFSDSFEEKPTEEQLRARAQQYIRNNKVGIPKLSINVSFEHLAQYEEYKQFATLETLNLGDTVTIHHGDLGVDVESRIVETTYNVLTEKYVNVVVGRIKADMSTAMQNLDTTMEQRVKESKNYIGEAVAITTNKITGVNGGYVKMNLDANGNPYEILIMDTEDKLTAVNVLRINNNGIGFSTNGYNGPFNTAWTIDGHFNADFITAGTISGNRIRTGIISDQTGTNYWNLDSGELSITIDTDNEDLSALTLNYNGPLGVLHTEVKPGSVQVSSNNTSVHLDADGIRFTENGLEKGWIPATGFKFVDINIVVDMLPEPGDDDWRHYSFGMNFNNLENRVRTLLQQELLAKISFFTIGSWICLRLKVDCVATNFDSSHGDPTGTYHWIFMFLKSSESAGFGESVGFIDSMKQKEGYISTSSGEYYTSWAIHYVNFNPEEHVYVTERRYAEWQYINPNP